MFNNNLLIRFLQVLKYDAVEIEDIEIVEFEDLPPPEGFANRIHGAQTGISDCCDRNWTTTKWIIIAILLIGYFVYFGFAMAYEFGSEPSIRLLWVTVVVVVCIALYVFWRYFGDSLKQCCGPCTERKERAGRIALWSVLFYLSNFICFIIQILYCLY